MVKYSQIGLTLVLVLSVGSASPALAMSILQPAGISSTFGSFSQNPLSHIIDQSGLFVGYTSGVTDFASYTATTTHNQTAGTFGQTNTPWSGLPQEFTFDLGGAMTIDAIAFWGIFGTGAVTAFDLYADTDGDITNGTGALLGSFNPGDPSSSSPSSAKVFSFASTTTPFIQLRATALFRGSGNPAIGEVAFRNAAAAVPEPSTIVLMGLGLVGLGYAGRRKLVS